MDFFEKTEKIFNMDAIFIERIGRRLEQLDIVTIEGDQIARYRLINTIFLGTFFKFEENVNKNLEIKLNDIKAILNKTNLGTRTSQNLMNNNVIFSNAEQNIDELQKDIINLLYKADLIFLKKNEPKMPEKEYEDDF